MNRTISITPPNIYIAGLLLFVALVMAIYWPGLSGHFLFDDIPNIVDNPDLRIDKLSATELRDAALSGHSGVLRRPVSMLSFSLNYYASGHDARALKLTNILIHLLCATGLLILTRALLLVFREADHITLTDRQIAFGSLFVAASWAVHPLNLSAVLYIVQRMTELSALFSIWALVCYVHGRRVLPKNGIRGWTWIAIAFVLLTPLAMFSKENGVLVPLFALAIEWTLFRFKSGFRDRVLLIGLYTLTLAVPLLGVTFFLIENPSWLSERYAIREFTLMERVLTEARVMWFYVAMIGAPNPSALSLYHDSWQISRHLFQPPITALAVIGLASALAAAVLLRRRFPIAALGIFLFFAGHTIESTVIPLELVFEHRNYFPMYGLLLLLLHVGICVKSSLARRIRPYLAVTIVGLLALSTAVRADYWGNPLRHAVMELHHNPQSARANHQAALLYEQVSQEIPNLEVRSELQNKAVQLYKRASDLDPGFTGGLFSLIELQNRLGKPADDTALAQLHRRLEGTAVRASSVNHLRHLIDCHRRGQCKFEPGIVENLISAILSNPSLAGRGRAMTLVAAANYMASQGATEQSLGLVIKALELDPDNIGLRLNLADALISLNRQALASEQLELAERYDRWHIYAQDIQTRREKLSGKSTHR